MKLATYQDGTRDGQLVVVSRDLASAHFATGIASRMRALLDDWNFLSPQLEDLSATLNDGKARHAFAFDPRLCMAPLPRAAHWAEVASDGLQPHAGDHFLGARAEIQAPTEGAGFDFGAGLAAITGDLPRGASAPQALDGVRLLMLANAWSELSPAGALERLADGFGAVAITPDELGPAWKDGRVHLTLHVKRNGKSVGMLDAASGMAMDFGAALAALARRRPLGAGTLVGSGSLRSEDPSKGYAAVANQRAHEAAADGEARTAFLVGGDSVHIELKGRDGASPFGGIEQRIAAPPA